MQNTNEDNITIIHNAVICDIIFVSVPHILQICMEQNENDHGRNFKYEMLNANITNYLFMRVITSLTPMNN